MLSDSTIEKLCNAPLKSIVITELGAVKVKRSHGFDCCKCLYYNDTRSCTIPVMYHCCFGDSRPDGKNVYFKHVKVIQ